MVTLVGIFIRHLGLLASLSEGIPALAHLPLGDRLWANPTPQALKKLEPGVLDSPKTSFHFGNIPRKSTVISVPSLYQRSESHRELGSRLPKRLGRAEGRSARHPPSFRSFGEAPREGPSGFASRTEFSVYFAEGRSMSLALWAVFGIFRESSLGRRLLRVLSAYFDAFPWGRGTRLRNTSRLTSI